jgi:hypothetical protein
MAQMIASLRQPYIGKLKDLGYGLTLEKEGDMFAFLGIDFKRNGSRIELTQTGLTQRVINYVGLADTNPKSTPAMTSPLGSNKQGQPFSEEWSSQLQLACFYISVQQYSTRHPVCCSPSRTLQPLSKALPCTSCQTYCLLPSGNLNQRH